MLTQDQLNKLKEGLIAWKEELVARLQGQHYGLEFAHVKESVGELSNYDNHPADHGTELFEREKDLALNEHSEHHIEEIDQALKAMEEGKYGKCEICGEDIPFERLEAVPTTKRCINHTEENKVSNNRPVEEDILAPAFGQFEYDESLQNETFFDAEDSWQAVSAYGTSETPSDFTNTEKDYNSMFIESEEPVGYVEEVEGVVTADIEGNYSGVSVDHRKYERYLDENGENDAASGYASYEREDL
ncbi:TraR/DksA C4-type zinc finger protein [Evansella sp. AB-P1]|uniref:TraR/DksA C4-type zinc finger protein n=1 Tax=Evansella sp. AB-P1 TaxID=3037653 RepID=UPI00241D7911|nr:TraR/DksA C4-type zinc finger protein [Evansella sp. AB-P1]MDG5788013.1 TraR/DksA C4-type zinc finger protein [Evansella sp. AB-P1]